MRDCSNLQPRYRKMSWSLPIKNLIKMKTRFQNERVSRDGRSYIPRSSGKEWLTQFLINRRLLFYFLWYSEALFGYVPVLYEQDRNEDDIKMSVCCNSRGRCSGFSSETQHSITALSIDIF